MSSLKGAASSDLEKVAPVVTSEEDLDEAFISLPVEKLLELDSLMKKLKDDRNELNSRDDERPREIFYKIEKSIQVLKDINQKGYVNETDLLKYPMINECIENFMLAEEKDPDPSVDRVPSKGVETMLGSRVIRFVEGMQFYR